MTAERDCRTLADPRRWDAYLADGVPPALADHARACPRCRSTLARLEQMRAGLAALAAAPAPALDLAARILARTADARIAETRPHRRAWLPLLAAVPVAAALALWLLAGERAPTIVRLDAAAGATVIRGGEARAVAGLDLPLELPAEIHTSPAQSATVRTDAAVLSAQPDSRLALEAPTAVTLARGAIDLATPTAIRLRAGPAELLVAGRLTLETAPPAQEPAMKILRRHKVAAAGAAVVAVALYAGHASITSRSTTTRIEAPGGLLLDGAGQLRRFALDAPGEAAATAAAAPSGEVAIASGAVWDEDRQLVVFRVAGEVFDAGTGAPIDSFELAVAPQTSLGYQQTRDRTVEVDKRAGKFELEGLGLGSWRVTARAAGYAPTTQTLDLADLTDDPFLAIPMSPGAVLTGKVIDWRGERVAGAKIGLAECVPRAGGAVHPDARCPSTTSAADGSFTLPALPEEQVFELYAEHPRFGYASHKNLRQAEGASEHVVIQLSGVVRIHGQVTRGPTREPVAGAEVASAHERTTTDEAGRYHMLVPLETRPTAFVLSDPARPNGRARTESYPDDRSAWQLRWVDAETHVAEVQIDFRLSMERGRLFGRVTDADGRPVADAELALHNSAGWAKQRGHETFPTRARTDADGRYAVDDAPVQAGYHVVLLGPGDDRRTLGFVSLPDETPVEANFQIGRASIRGRFVDARGATVPISERACSRLGARRADAAYHEQVHCYPDGRFEVDDLPAGAYTLENQLPTMASPVVFKPTRVTLAPGQIAEEVAVAVDGSPADRYRLRVLDDQSRFVANPMLRYHHGGGKSSTSFTQPLEVGADGTAEITLDRIYRTIFIDVPGYRPTEIRLEGRDPAKVIEVRVAK